MTDNPSKIIGSNFSHRRQQLGLTKTYVGRRLGYNRHWVLKLERGQTCFDLSLAPTVKELLKLKSIEELLKP